MINGILADGNIFFVHLPLLHGFISLGSGMMPATITILFSLFLPSQFLMSKVTMFVLGWTPRFGVQILNSTTLASATHGGLLN